MMQNSGAAVSDTVKSAHGDQPVSVGSALRGLRLAKGWSIDEVAGRIKFSARQIDALENEVWAELPSGVSLRGLVRNYARLLGVESQDLVNALDPQAQTIGPVRLNPGSLHSSNSLSPTAPDFERSSGSKLWVMVIFFLLIAGLAYAFWRGWLPAQWLPASWSDKLIK